MKLAVTGKGGAGKTTIAGTLARLLARRGHRVVALDCDPSPTLGISLGLSRQELSGLQPLMNALWDSGLTHDDPRPHPDELLGRYGHDAPDGVRLLLTGLIQPTPGRCVCCGSHSTTRAIFGELDAGHRFVIADLEAGLNDLVWASPAPEDMVLLVAEDTGRSVEIARRALGVARAMGVERILAVANRSSSPAAAGLLTQALGVEAVAVPEDPAVEEAAVRGAAPLDRAGTSPAIAAIETLAERLEAAAVSS